MVTYTPILKLAQPVFDQEPWDQEINNDLAVLDGVIGGFFAIPNFVGMWQNSTGYNAVQTVIDASDSSMWSCLVTHTSAALPTTFAQDRTARPTLWSNIVPSVAESASAAADAAAAAEIAKEAAEDAADAAAASAVNSVLKTGSTMTGPLILSGDPTAVTGAATKQYVDARVGGTGYLATTGGVMTGHITLPVTTPASNQAVPKSYADLMLPMTGGSMSNFITLHTSAPTLALHAASKGYVDTKVSTASFLPTGGGTVTGTLNVSNGKFASYNTSGQPCVVVWDQATIAAGMYIDSSQLRFGQFNASLGLHQYWGAMDANGIATNGGIQAAGAILGSSGVYAYNAQFGLFEDVTYRYGLYAGVLYTWRWDKSNGDMTWMSNNSATLTIRTSDKLLINSLAGVSAFGPYTNLSDARSKRDIEPVVYGLKEILALNPVSFHRVSHDDAASREIGFVAQDVMKEVPEAVNVVGIPLPDGTGGVDSDDPTKGVAVEMLFAVAVNAIKELAARIADLEEVAR